MNSIEKVLCEKKPVFVFEKVGETRGRPSKFVKEGETLVPYKDWLAREIANLPKEDKDGRGRKAYPRDAEGNIIRPQVILEAPKTIVDNTSNPIGLESVTKVVQTAVSEKWIGVGLNTRTINGTEVVIIPPADLDNTSNMVMIWAGKIGREYKTLINAKDLIRPMNLPADLKVLKFAGEEGNTEVVEAVEPIVEVSVEAPVDTPAESPEVVDTTSNPIETII